MKEHPQRKRMLELMNALRVEENSNATIPDLGSLYKNKEGDKNILFAENFTKAGGKFMYCLNDVDFRDKLTTLIEYNNWQSINCYSKPLYDFLNLPESKISLFKNTVNEQVGLSLCQNLIARTGSVVFTSFQGLGSDFIQVPKTFIVTAFTSQVVTNIRETYEQMNFLHKKTLPKVVLTLTVSEMLRNEMDEFYLFLIEDTEVD